MRSSQLRNGDLGYVGHDGGTDESRRHSSQDLGSQERSPVLGDDLDDDGLDGPMRSSSTDRSLNLRPFRLTANMNNVKIHIFGRNPKRSAVMGDSICINTCTAKLVPPQIDT